jgi:carboxyl-terminal processing protease
VQVSHCIVSLFRDIIEMIVRKFLVFAISLGGLWFALQACNVFAGEKKSYDPLEALMAEPSETNTNTKNSAEKNKAILAAMMAMIDEGHFSKRELNDDFSIKVYDKFLEYLDYNKQLFTAGDIDKFKKYRLLIDDQIKAGSLEFYDAVMAVFIERREQSKATYDKWIATPYTFDTNEEIMLDGKKLNWAKDEKQLDDRWRKTIKYRTLMRFVELQEAQDKAKDTVKDYKVLTVTQLEDSSRKSVKKNMDYGFRRQAKDGEAEFFSMYCNAIAGNEDPHTDYMPPKDKKKFDEQMSGTFYGIGAVLRVIDGNCQIQQIVAGTPSWKQGSLKVDDVIMKVAQGEKEPVEVTGWDVEDIVTLIRGDKGTEVRLHVKHKDGKTEIIPIVRDEVKTEDVFAKSAVIEDNGKKIGYIYLPEFYADFQKANGKRCAADMRVEVQKLVNEEKIDGLVLDLRWNGGGSLTDVVDIATLFVNNAASVQVKTTNSAPSVMKNYTKGILYEGPMTVLVNTASASASEILAGALQDYKRAVIVGSTTHGKGTVQRIFNLDEFASQKPDLAPLAKKVQADGSSLGNLKLTIQKFYRITGNSTQLKGVVPDVTIPDYYMYLENGERKLPSALEYDEIASADFKGEKGDKINLAINNSKSRIKQSAYFKTVEERAKQIKKQQDDNTYPLNLVKYKAKLEEVKAFNKSIEALDKEKVLLEAFNCRADMDRVLFDDASKKKNEDWLKALKKDATVKEAVNIVQDIIKA